MQSLTTQTHAHQISYTRYRFSQPTHEYIEKKEILDDVKRFHSINIVYLGHAQQAFSAIYIEVAPHQPINPYIVHTYMYV